MSTFRRYIAEEIATDHVDGLVSRREALRRMALLGVGTAAATAMIAACGDSKDAAPTTSASPSTKAAPPPGSDKTVPTNPITWAGPDGELQGAWAQAQEPKGGVIVLHENKGLTDWVRSVAGRLAGVGYNALAIDLLSEEGGTAKFPTPEEATAALGKIERPRFVADIKSGLDEVAKRTPDRKLGVIGFCMGGGLTWELLASGEPRIAAAVPYYGPLPENPDFAGSKQAAVLALYAAKDDRVNATKDAAQAALRKAGMINEFVVEPDSEHAFFNDTGQRYNAFAAADAWRRTVGWFGRHLA